MASEQIKIDNIPQNDWDKKLSEKERLAWIKYSTEQLSDDVLRSLRVDVNWVSKYIKDVIYYNSDVEAIMKNPEELIKLQLFLKKKTGADIDISGTYDKKTEIAINEYRKNRNIEWEMAFFQNQNPAFNALIQKYPTRFEEIKKRAALYNELEKMKWEITYLKKNGENPNITQIQKALVANLDVDIFNTKTVYTQIEWWNWPGSINYLWLGGENVTYTEYIRRLLNKNWIITELFWNTWPSNEQALDRTQKAQLWRAKIFVQSLIARNPGLNMDNKKDIDKIYAMLNTWNVDNALNLINKLTREKFSLTVDFSTKKWLGVALRAIWDTQTAWSVIHSELNEKIVEMKDTQDTNPEALQRFNNTYSENNARLSKDSNAERIIQKKFDDMMASILNDPTSEYYYLIGDSDKQKQVKAGLMALMVFDETMKQTWPNWLWELAEIYDDMKWLNWLLNFTDENVKMTKEIAIMLASMAVTAWLWVALSWVWGALRVAQANRLRKAVEVANKAWKIAKIGTWLSKATWFLAWKWARIFEISASAVNKINSIPVIGNALVFTMANEWLRRGFHNEWEMIADIESFSKSLVANTAMFSLFAWTGKITEWLISKFKIAWAFKQFWVLTAWDIGWMYILNCIETGRYNPTPEEWAMIAAQAIWYRWLMKWIEKMYPRVATKMKDISSWETKNKKLSQKAITADAGKTRINETKQATNSELKSWDKVEYKNSKWKAMNWEIIWMEWDSILFKWNDWKQFSVKKDKLGRFTKIDGSNKNQLAIENKWENSNLETLKEKYKKIEYDIQMRIDQMKINRSNWAKWLNRHIREDLKKIIKERNEIRAEIKKIEGSNEIIKKTVTDLKINKFQKEIEEIEVQLRKLNQEKVLAENELKAAKEAFEKMAKNNPERAERLWKKLGENIKLREEALANINKSIGEYEQKLKGLNNKIEQVSKQRTDLITEKNKVNPKEELLSLNSKEFIDPKSLPVVIPEVVWKTKLQTAKDWLKTAPKGWLKWISKENIARVVLLVWWVAYGLMHDKSWNLVPIQIPSDNDSEENNTPIVTPEQESAVPQWEWEGWQEWQQGWSTEGGSQWVTPVVPSTPNKWWKWDKEWNKKGAKPKWEGKSWGQSGWAAIWTWSPSGISWGSKPEWAQSAVNLQEQIKAKQASLLGDLQNIYKNRYQDLKDIGLWDAFFGLDKGVELDENPIYLDYDGTINGRIIVNSKWEYQITLDNKKAIAWYTANAIITWNDLFEILTKWYTIWREINKAEVKVYQESREKEEEKRRFYGA